MIAILALVIFIVVICTTVIFTIAVQTQLRFITHSILPIVLTDDTTAVAVLVTAKVAI